MTKKARLSTNVLYRLTLEIYTMKGFFRLITCSLIFTAALFCSNGKQPSSLENMNVGPMDANTNQPMQQMPQGQMDQSSIQQAPQQMPQGALQTPMNLYLVTMESVPISPAVAKRPMLNVMETMLIPGFQSLVDLMDKQVVLAGGAISGVKSVAFIVQAQSNDELNKMLMQLPLWDLMKTTVIPLDSLSSRLSCEKQNLDALKNSLSKM